MIRLCFFAYACLMICIAVGLSMGEVQKLVKFNSVDSEIFMFMLCSVSGVLFLIYSIKPNKNDLS